jgi:hypothetical protein
MKIIGWPLIHYLPRYTRGLQQKVARRRPKLATVGANLREALACHGLRNAFFGLGAGGITRKMSQHAYLGLLNLKTRRIDQEVSSPGNCFLSLPNRRACAIIVWVELVEVARTHFEPFLPPSPFPDDLKSPLEVSLSRQDPE